MPYRQSPAVRAVDPDEALARAALEPELLVDEQLLWAARPRRGVLPERGEIFSAFFAVAWAGALVSGGMRAVLGGSLPLPTRVLTLLVCAGFVAPFLYIFAGRSFTDARKRARTFYGISNQRMLIVTLGPPRVVTEHWLARLPYTSVEQKSRGFGHIHVNSPTYIDQSARRRYETPEMTHVPNVAEVHRLLRGAMAAARPR